MSLQSNRGIPINQPGFIWDDQMAGVYRSTKYPLAMTSLPLYMAIEIVSLPIQNGDVP